MKATFRPRALVGATLLALWAGSAFAQRGEDLLDIYRLASNNDAVIRQARAQFNATHTNVSEALANWLPNITLQGQSARNTQAPTVSHKLSEGFNTHNYSLNLTQNLINFEAWYSFQSVRQNDRQAMTTLAQAEQQLILRVAGAYFDVLRSQNNLALFEAEENAAREVMNQSQERYDLGFGQISDIFDSQAAHARARVNRMDEANLLRQRIQALEIITGGAHSELRSLNDNFPVVSADPHSIEEWLELTQQNNLAIKSAQFTLASTELQAKAAKAAMLPTLTINGNYSDTAERDNPFAFISGASNSSAIGVTLSMPLSRGGANRARLQRAYYTIDANKEALSQVERQNLAQTRNSFNNIETALETVAARLETIQLAERALEATEVGIEVGTRNIVDLMQAQRTLYQARRDYANARFDYVINTLNLKQAAGTLSPQDVIDLNEWLR
jgi:outer membrane protein